MKYDNRRAFEKHIESASPHHFSPLYLIIGKEISECKEIVNTLIHSLLGQKSRSDLSVSFYQGQELNGRDFFMDFQTDSFFSDKRIFCIQQCEKIKKPLLDHLEEQLGRLNRKNHLILTASILSKATTFYKKAEKEGVILELPELKPWEKEKKLTEWVGQQATALSKLMNYQVCQFFVKQVGNDELLLKQEWEKLLCYIGDKKEITHQDIRNISSYASTETIWQLGEAIFRRDGASAVRMASHFLTTGGALLPLLRQIRTQFQTEFQVCALLEQGKPASEITQQFPYMKGQILEHHMQLARSYGIGHFKQGLLLIDETEAKMKNTLIGEELLLELLIVKLTTKSN